MQETCPGSFSGLKRALTIAALCLPLAASPSAALDHFKCYPNEIRKPADVSVELRDQFGEGKARVLEAMRFCNPAKKVHDGQVSPIRDEDAHLSFYRIETGRARQRQVRVSNQFGREQELAVGRPIFLAVPSQKLEPRQHPAPRNQDHMKCYETRGEPVGVPVALGDQFGSEDGLKVGTPRVLCNPAEKIHRGKKFKIRNPDDHLVCYDLGGTRKGASAFMRTQFGEQPLKLRPADLLCVPSRKRDAGPARVPGEIKKGDTERTAKRDALGDAPPPLKSCKSPTPDFVVTGSETTAPGDDHCFPSDGAGNFGPRSDIPRLGIVDGMDVADMDGDGDNDFLACDGSKGEVYLYTQGPPGDFHPKVVSSGVTSGDGGSLFCTYLRIGDFDEDGSPDFVVGDNRVTEGTFVYLQGPAGTFNPVLPGLDVGWASPSGARCNCLFGLAAGDADGDGHEDVMVLGYRGAGAGQVWFYRGDGLGNMAPPVLKFNVGAAFPVVQAPTGIAHFDHEGDGDLDLIVGGSSDGSHYVYTNNGLGNFAAPGGSVFSTGNYTGIDAYDLDGDADDDLMLVDWSSRKLLSSENLGGALGAPAPEGNVDGSSIGVGAPATGSRPSPGLDHFKCYPAEADRDVDAEVTLVDQFGGGRYKVHRADHFCNPVEKVHNDAVTPIRDRDAHLELYRVEAQTGAEPRQVTVSNQFGEGQRITAHQPVLLAVPTQKIEPGGHPPPRGLDHLLCYEAEGEQTSVLLELRDQFGFEPEVQLLEPRLLCNPAEKVHDGKETPVENPKDHLTCYGLEGPQMQASAQVRNQFGEEFLGLQPSDLLCVPSRKREPHQDPNVTKMCGAIPAVYFDGGMVPPGGPGTGLLPVNPDATWPDGRPRRPCGAYVPIDGYLPSGGVKQFRIAFREHTDPVPALGTAPGIQTKWILDDRSDSPSCDDSAGQVLETSGPLGWMDAGLYLEAKSGGPSTNNCPNSGLRLAVWDSAGAPDPDGHYVVWLEWEDTGGILHKEPFEHHLQLDNTLPVLSDLKVTLSDGTTPVGACGETEGESLFKVSAEFSDDYYWSYLVKVSGGNPPITVGFPRPAEDPDSNGWHDYYDGTPQVANTDKTGTTGSGLVLLRDVDMTELGASFTDCCYLLRLYVRDAAIRHKFNHRVATETTSGYWDDVSKFITFSASPP